MAVCTKCNYESSDSETACPVCGRPYGGRSIKLPTTIRSRVNTTANTPVSRAGSMRVSVRPETLVRTRSVLIMLVLDTSGSMEGRKIKQVHRSVLAMLDVLVSVDAHCRVGVVTFSHRVSLEYDLMPPTELQSRIVPFSTDGGTDIAVGLAEANETLSQYAAVGVSANGSTNQDRLICVLSDGDHNASSDPFAEAERAKSSGSILMTIAYGKDASHRTLRKMASSEDLFFAKPATGGELMQFFKNLGTATQDSIRQGQSLRRSLTQF